MSNSRKKNFSKSVFFSLISKVIMFVLGIIIPRLIILNYGSEINGFLSTVANLFTYLALIQAGIGTAATQALYKPVAENNREKISEILNATQKYFTKILPWYFLAVVILSVVFPFIIKSTLTNYVVFSVILIHGVSTMLNFGMVASISQLLLADGRHYVGANISLLIFIINSIIKIILVSKGINIVILELAYLVVNVFQIFLYIYYVKRNYPWIDWKASPDFSAFTKRTQYLTNTIAWTVVTSTDTVIISIFCGLIYSSIYAIYNLIYANINIIVYMLYGAGFFILGQIFHEDRERFIQLNDDFESIFTGIGLAIISTVYIITIPFIKIYTAGADINYVDKYLPLLFCLVQILSYIRLTSNNVIEISNKPDLITKISVCEAVINLSLSIILAKFFGIYGVLIATVIALAFKITWTIFIVNKKILNRTNKKTYKIIIGNILVFLLVVFVDHLFKIEYNSYLKLFLTSIPICIGILIIFFIVNYILNPHIIVVIKSYLKRK